MTEEEFVYSIIELLRDNEYNNDERISERFIRDMLKRYRGKELRIYYSNGMRISDEVIQAKTLTFDPDRKGKKGVNINSAPKQYVSTLPKMIRLDNFGMRLEVMGETIPIVSSESFKNSSRLPFSNKLVVAKTDGHKVTIKLPDDDSCITDGPNRIILDYIKDPINGSQFNRKFKVKLYSVLDDPSEADDYDWTKDIYPFPSERIDDFFYNMIRREFSILTEAKRDEVQNSRSDSIRYHDNSQINKPQNEV